MSNQGFSFKKFIEDSKKTLVSPKEYFSTMETTGGIGEPVVKALIYGAIAGIFALIWSLLNLTASSGWFGGGVGFIALIWSIIAAVIGVFIGGLIVLIISSIAKGNTEFEPSMRVAASLMVIMPIGAFFGFLGGVVILSKVISLAINLYALYLLYIGITVALKGNDQPAKIVSYVLGGLLILFFIIGMATRGSVNRISKSYEKEASKVIKEYEKAAKEAAKELEEASKELEDE
ncbi:MAG TPA: Yip1 family protein [Bacteroidales bacterium]|nr:Yip1 family protein [Bacteroidales bacterium]